MIKKSNYKKGGFYWERELYQSGAFLSLKKNSIKILIALLDNRDTDKHRNKDRKGNKQKPKFINLHRLEIPYGVLEKVYKINRSSIPDAIDELLEKGFVEIVHHGGAYKRDKSIYAWSDNYLIWKPAMKPFSERPKRERHGYQGRRLGAKKPEDRNGPAELN